MTSMMSPSPAGQIIPANDALLLQTLARDHSSGPGIDLALERLAALLADGANPSAALPAQETKEDAGVSALHLAAREQREHPAFTALLLAHGANVHARDHKGNTPLLLACLENAEAVCALLIGRGARLDARNHLGTGPLPLMLHRLDADGLYRLVQAMDGEQLRCAAEEAAALQAKLNTQNTRLRFLAGVGGVDNTEHNCAMTISMVQSRQAALAIEALTGPATPGPGRASP